jgi:hypothetical protein
MVKNKVRKKSPRPLHQAFSSTRSRHEGTRSSANLGYKNSTSIRHIVVQLAHATVKTIRAGGIIPGTESFTLRGTGSSQSPNASGSNRRDDGVALVAELAGSAGTISGADATGTTRSRRALSRACRRSDCRGRQG